MEHSLEVLLQIVNSEVDMFRIWSCVPRISIGTRIETSEDTLAATKVVPSGRDPSPWVAKHGAVIGSGLVNVGDWYNHAKESSGCHISKRT